MDRRAPYINIARTLEHELNSDANLERLAEAVILSLYMDGWKIVPKDDRYDEPVMLNDS